MTDEQIAAVARGAKRLRLPPILEVGPEIEIPVRRGKTVYRYVRRYLQEQG